MTSNELAMTTGGMVAVAAWIAAKVAAWILVGGVLLGNRLGVLHTNIFAYWPLLLVLVGLRIVWQTFAANRTGRIDVDDSAMVSAVAVMGGVDRRIVAKQFRGGELTAFW